MSILLALGAALALAGCEPPPPLLSLTVTTTADTRDANPGDGVCEATAGAGDCSLRAAVDEANAATSAVQIRVPAGSYALARPGTDDTNAGGDLDVASPGGDVVILATQPGVMIDAAGLDGAVDVRTGTVQLWGFAISGATGDAVSVRAGAHGFVVVDTLHGNGGAGATVEAGATLTVHDATLEGNGGAGIANAGTVDATFATITRNGAGGVSGTGTLALSGSVVASQTAGADCATAVASSSASADTDHTCGLAGPGDQPGATPLLGTLAGLPGHLPVVSPQPGSPLIDAIASGSGPCVADAVDERGHPRPFAAACDIGAVEADFGLHLLVDNPADIHDTNPGDGVCDIGDGTCTLRAAVDESNLRSVAGYPNSIDLRADPTLSLTGAGEDANATGDLDITAPVNLSGAGHTIDAADVDRVLDVRSDGVSVDLVTIRGGRLAGTESQGGAGIRHTTGHLVVRRSTVSDNTYATGPSSPSAGGGIATFGTALEVDASTIARNRADDGGAVFQQSGTVTITVSTLSDNVGGAFLTPGGFTSSAVNATLTRTSIAGNVPGTRASYGGAAVIAGVDSFCNLGGCQSSPGAPVTVTASALANPTDCTNITSGGFNVSRTGCGSQPTDQTANSWLAPLGGHGGPTPTRPALSGAPGIDAIPTGTVGLCDPDGVDQRGEPRPIGSGCDVGAVEGDAGYPATPLALTVDDAGDRHDTDLSDPACTTAGGGCTLRAAIDQANAWPTVDTIAIAPGIDPTVTLPGTDDDANATGDLDVTDELTIAGDTAGATVDGGRLDRVLDDLWGTSLTVTDLTVRRGAVNGDGGGVRLTGPFTGQRLTLTDNAATNGGGLAATAASAVDLTDTTLSANHATAAGGGAFARTLTGTQLTVTDNTAGTRGGGVQASSLTLTSATIERNQAQTGAGVGLVDNGTSALTALRVRDNTATFSGGGIETTGTVTIADSSVETNRATLAGWGTGGGIAQDSGTLTVQRSLVAGNTARVRGGGLFVAAGTLAVRNTTIDSNTGGTDGGGVSIGSGSTSFAFATITHNGLTGPGFGAGVASANSGYPVVTFAATALDNLGEDCWALSASSAGYNVSASCPLTAPTDARATRSKLAPLAANGGPTRSRLPFADSPLVGVVPAGTPLLCDGTLTTDQRGVARPTGAACDTGAVEGASAGPATPRTFTVDSALDAPDVDPADGTCATSTGTCTLRAAVDEANAWPATDTIEIAAGIDPVLGLAGADEPSNHTGDIDIADPVTIEGHGATIDGAGLDRVLRVDAAAATTVRDVTLTGGTTTEFTIDPGAGLSTQSTLTAERVTISGAVGDALGSRVGAGSVTLTDSTVTGSTGTAVNLPDHAVVVSGSTIDGNGAGIVAGSVTIERTTVSDNAGTGVSSTAGGTITASTVAGNTVGITSGPILGGSVLDNLTDCSGPAASAGYNIAGTASCGLAGPGDLVAAPQLDALAANGGATRTRLLYASSPAVDHIPTGTAGLCDASLPTDQRGVSRPAGAGCDAGAVEGTNGITLAALDLTVTSPLDGSDANPGDGTCATNTAVCTLRAAIGEANAWPTADTITIAPGVDPVLTIAGANEDADLTGDLDVTGSLTIDGGDATVDGGGLDRVFDLRGGSVTLRHLAVRGGAHWSNIGSGIVSGATTVLDHVTVTGNVSHLGGAVAVTGGTTVVRDSAITHNRGDGGGGSDAGGLSAANDATLVVERSTIEANRSSGYGGGIDATNTATVSVTSSTVTGNTARWPGAAIHADATATVAVTASTITHNAGDSSLAGPMTVSATLLDTATGAACAAPVTSAGYNISSDASCGLAGVSDQQSLPLRLLGLATNGGPTRSALPFANSPALDVIPAGTAGLCDTSLPSDQRGVARPAGGACDIGAVEGHAALADVSGPRTFTVTAATDSVDATPGDGVCATAGAVCTLRAAIDEADARLGADAIVISPGIDPTLSLAGADEDENRTGDLDITDSVTITGTDAVISAAHLDRVLDAVAADVSLQGVTIRDGRITAAAGRGGGIRVTGGHLTIHESTVRDNAVTGADGQGGGVVVDLAPGDVTASTFTGNQVAGFTGAGGAWSSDWTDATFTNTTITGNTAFSGSAIHGDVWAPVHLRFTTIGPSTGLSALDGVIVDYTASVITPEGGSACSGTAGGLFSGGYNVLADASCGAQGPTDRIATYAFLGALAANGGPTLTQLPEVVSPVNGIIPAGTAGLCDGSTADQRGVARPVGGACEAGAVEK